MGLLEGKSTVITGAGRGIGKACAAVFVREGARVLAVDFSGAEKDTAAELGSAVVPLHATNTQGSGVDDEFVRAAGVISRQLRGRETHSGCGAHQ